MYIRPCKKKKAHCLTVLITFSYTALHVTSEVEHNGFRLLKFLQLLQIAKGWVDCPSRGDKCRGEKGVVNSGASQQERTYTTAWLVIGTLSQSVGKLSKSEKALAGLLLCIQK